MARYASTTGEDITPTKYSAAYGGLPTLPSYAEDTQKTVGTDVYSQLVKNLPNYESMVAESSGNIAAWQRGELAPDVIRQEAQLSAERGIGMGAPGSTNLNTQLLKALGLNSFQMQQLAEKALSSAVARTPIQQTSEMTKRTDLSPQQAIYNAMAEPEAAAKAAESAAKAGIAAASRGTRVPAAGGISMPAAAAAASTVSKRDPWSGGPSPQTYTAGGSGGESLYPGYHWDPGSGQYVKDSPTAGWGMSYGGDQATLDEAAWLESMGLDPAEFGYGSRGGYSFISPESDWFTPSTMENQMSGMGLGDWYDTGAYGGYDPATANWMSNELGITE